MPATDSPQDRAAHPGTCSVCGASGKQTFFEVTRVPVHSILNLRTREEAESFPRGGIRLSVCPVCGFIQNDLFDPSTQRFGPDYEETQGCSSRFREFHVELASRLVARHGLRGKRLIEIGCGKGDFLHLLCRHGGNTGIGFDPSWVPRGEETPGVEFAAVHYGPDHAGLKTDFICCKMTLEHIAGPLDFLRMIRANLNGAGWPAIFMMVPDAARILREAAFWDIYYEHCNYFTTGSLKRLFSRAGFDVEWLGAEFDGQYAAIEARPTEGKGHIPDDSADGTDATLPMVSRFAERAARSIRAWRDTLVQWHAKRRRTVLWGGGSKAVAFLGAVAPGDAITAVVDINPHRQGAWLPGVAIPVQPPAALQTLRPTTVVLMNAAYRDEVRKSLADLGLQPEIVVLGEKDPDGSAHSPSRGPKPGAE